ncbi:hypothetical protein LCGC14_0884650 [marine sediment metagenome]|uniref:Uncharacterized protein n=1 Tax=marine sediment metagenome TaxID=412755 RepID=A0A0F9S7U7_9ZZZZ
MNIGFWVGFVDIIVPFLAGIVFGIGLVFLMVSKWIKNN